MNVKNTEMNHFIGAYYALHNENFLPYSKRMWNERAIRDWIDESQRCNENVKNDYSMHASRWKE